MQGITTEYKHSRNNNAYILAKADAGTLRVPRDYELNADVQHVVAANALLDTLEWGDAVIGGTGSMPGSNGNVYMHTIAYPGK